MKNRNEYTVTMQMNDLMLLRIFLECNILINEVQLINNYKIVYQSIFFVNSYTFLYRFQ
jgi:hypothetical protein